MSMDLRKELNILIKPMKEENPYIHPTHIVFFGAKEDERHEYIYIYEKQINLTVEFLKDKVEMITITELGRNIVTLTK